MHNKKTLLKHISNEILNNAFPIYCLNLQLKMKVLLKFLLLYIYNNVAVLKTYIFNLKVSYSLPNQANKRI